MIRQYFYSFTALYTVGLAYCIVSERMRHLKKIEEQKKDFGDMYERYGFPRPERTFL